MNSPTQSDKTELENIAAFLCGEKALDGRWFGEDYTSEGVPMFWWRGRLREAISALTAREERLLKQLEAAIGEYPDDIHLYNGELRGKWEERRRARNIVADLLSQFDLTTQSEKEEA